MENLDTYFAQIGETELLEPEVEAGLIRQAYSGRLLEEMQSTTGIPDDADSETAETVIQRGREAQARLVTANLKFVPYWLKRHGLSKHSDFPDLIQWGNVGLVIAAREIEPREDVRFVTFAAHCIRTQVLNYGITDNVISVPRRLQVEVARRNREDYDGGSEASQSPTWNINPLTFTLGKQALRPAISLSSQHPSKRYWRSVLARGAITDEENLADYPRFDEVLPALATADAEPGESIMADQLGDTIVELTNDRLNPTEQVVIGMRFGLFEIEGYGSSINMSTPSRGPATLSEIAETIGYSPDQVRIIQNRALSRLRHPLASKKLREHV